MDTPVWIGIIIGALVVVVSLLLVGKKKQSQPKEQPKPIVNDKQQISPATKKVKPDIKKQSAPKHPRLVISLKHHSREVVQAQFSPCGRYFASTSEDQTLRVFSTDSLHDGTHGQHKRVTIPGDVPGRFVFSNNGNYLLVATQMNRTINIYTLTRKKEQKLPNAVTLSKQIDARSQHQTIASVDFSNNHKYILACGAEDTKISLYNVNGKILTSFATNQMKNHMACFTPDSKFVSIAAFTAEVRLWEIVEEKETQDFKSLQKAIRLSSTRGHKKGIRCLDFTPNSENLVTGSSDGSWKLWNIANLDYKRGEEAKCLVTGEIASCKEIEYLSVSPDGKKLACVSQDHIYFWSLDGKLVDEIPSAHNGKINSVHWSADSKLFCTSSTDCTVSIWKGN